MNFHGLVFVFMGVFIPSSVSFMNTVVGVVGGEFMGADFLDPLSKVVGVACVVGGAAMMVFLPAGGESAPGEDRQGVLSKNSSLPDLIRALREHVNTYRATHMDYPAALDALPGLLDQVVVQEKQLSHANVRKVRHVTWSLLDAMISLRERGGVIGDRAAASIERVRLFYQRVTEATTAEVSLDFELTVEVLADQINARPVTAPLAKT